MTTAGLSPAGTESNASTRALMSLPSTRTVRHPNASHLSTIGFGAQHPGGGAVGLQSVHVDHAQQVAQAVVGRGHRGLPGGALVEFAVAHHVDHAGGVALEPQAQGHADGDAEAVAQGAAGDLHAGGVGAHPGHRQPGVVGAVGVQLLDGEDAGLGQSGVLGDGVVAHGQQHPVPAVPVRVLGVVGGRGPCRSRRARRRSRGPGRRSPGPAPRPCPGCGAGSGRRRRPGRPPGCPGQLSASLRIPS